MAAEVAVQVRREIGRDAVQVAVIDARAAAVLLAVAVFEGVGLGVGVVAGAAEARGEAVLVRVVVEAGGHCRRY